jgi:hypothetical protein
MNKIDTSIYQINEVVCENIKNLDSSDRGLLAQNILSQLRNLVESVSLKVYSNGRDIDVNYENITHAIAYIKARGDLKFLKNFHHLLQITVSHYTPDKENSERLMLKYFEYLIRIKTFLKTTYSIDILENLEEFPIHTDSNLKEYYEKIAIKVNEPELSRSKSSYNDRYYIQKIKPFFVGLEIYYEVTFTRAHDFASKFDRIIAFTKLDISSNYAVRLVVSNSSISILGKSMPIKIIDSWEVSIRPCELNNFADIFGKHRQITGTIEYRELMKFLTTGSNLIELVNLEESYYKHYKKSITETAKSFNIFNLLDSCRELIKNNRNGSNVISYLLFKLNNKIIKKQYYHIPCDLLSNLHLSIKCKPFDQLPFNSSLVNHNPKLSHVFSSIDTTDREHEILAKHIHNNITQRGQLYTPKNELENFEDIDNLVKKWNESIYFRHTNRRIEEYKNHLYVKGYEEDTFHIIEELKTISLNGIRNYTHSVNSWLQSSAYNIDSEEKKVALQEMFENSKVALIYGAAGTGKTTMINHVSNFFNDKNKLYLANTNPAVDNLKRRVEASNCTFKTIAKFTRSHDTEYDILIIDECSTVSNSDIRKILNIASFELIILVGDVYQIESILFGNWFSLIRSFVPESSVFELTKPYRSNNTSLLDLWNRVRNIDDTILEHITKNHYSVSLDESIFAHTADDEIILCLNYDGLYGINNINTFLQSSNGNQAVVWGTHTYKVNDPVIFNESDRFTPLIYNNLKGKITRIDKQKEKIVFDIQIDKTLNEFDALGYDFQLMDNAENGDSIIRFSVDKYKSTDEDDEAFSTNIVPFQVAYAVSIHKAQGLEYKSVKIVITDEVEEMISHNIFYTAITRAQEKLKIYWTPETENKILSELKHRFNRKDLSLLKSKYKL